MGVPNLIIARNTIGGSSKMCFTALSITREVSGERWYLTYTRYLSVSEETEKSLNIGEQNTQYKRHGMFVNMNS